MKKKFLLVSGFIIIAGILWYVNRSESSSLVAPLGSSGNVVTPTATPSPSPTPIMINQDSNLEDEVTKLAPEDFSSDFQKLKEDINNL